MRYFVLSRALSAAFLAVLVFALPASAEHITGDTFDDNSRDSHLWAIGVTRGRGVQVAEVNGRLEITVPATSGGDTFSDGYVSRCVLSGDFTVSVDYQLLEWPAANGVRVGLVVAPSAAFDGGNYGLSRVSFGTFADFPGYPREVLTADGGGAINVMPASGLAGTLRVARNGTQMTASAREGDAWMELGRGVGPAGDVFVAIGAWSHDYAFQHQTVRAAFDNLRVEQGGFLCPDDGLPGGGGDGDGGITPPGGATTPELPSLGLLAAGLGGMFGGVQALRGRSRKSR